MKNQAILLDLSDMDELDIPKFEKVKKHRKIEEDMMSFHRKTKHNRANKRQQKRDFE
jgi:hypothetical protein